MGLSIHYSGIINERRLIPVLIEEIQDVCTILDWPYKIYNEETVKGISFVPPKCEPVFFTFLDNSELVCLSKFKYDIHPATIISVKTQFAGMDVHRTLIKLLKHLKARYFSKFKLSDESYYWETGDEELLQKKFEQYNFLLNAVGEALKKFKGKEGDTPETVADRLEKFLNERLEEK